MKQTSLESSKANPISAEKEDMERKHNSRSKRLMLTALSVVAILVMAAAFSACQRSSSGPAEPITIGAPPLESSALIYVAEHQGFFAANGLNVTIRQYDTGAASLNGLLNREVEIATPAEYALVGKAFQKDSVRAIASIDKVQYFYLIGRKDRGIEHTSDLKGKKIGVVTKTTAEFYLGRFLELMGMNVKEVAFVDINIAQSGDVIMNGDIDAIISRPPYVSAIEERLGENAVIWPAQSRQALYAIMIGRNDWIGEHPNAVTRLLRALAQAEEFNINHPSEAQKIVQERLNLDDAYVATVWSQNQFALTLDQSLIAAMEDQARWMIQQNLTPEKQVPDFLDYVYLKGLEAVKPRAVNIIRTREER